MTNFSVNHEDANQIIRIGNRVRGLDPRSVFTNIIMVLRAAQCAGANLDFDKMIDASSEDLMHDINGILDNIDHETGKLKNNFLPKLRRK